MGERQYAIGLYGLKIEDKIDSMQWLFGDATLSCADIDLFKQYSQNSQERAVIEATFGVRQWSDAFDISSVPFSDRFQRVAPPDSFIFVKRKPKNNNDDAEMAIDVQKRAREIASLLCLCRSFGSLNVSGYMDFTYLHESPMIGFKVLPYFDPSSNYFKSTHKVISPAWIRKPDIISSAQLTNALDGAPIKTDKGRAWSIHKEIPFVRVMMNQKRTPSEQRLVRASIVAYHAHHALSPELRLAQAVTSMEMLFPGNTEFKQLIQRLSQLNIYDNGSRDKIDEIMTCRHLYVHDGNTVPEGAAQLALGIAATIMHCYAEGLEKYKNTDALVKRLDVLEKASELMTCGETEKKAICTVFPPVATDTKNLLLQLRKADSKN